MHRYPSKLIQIKRFYIDIWYQSFHFSIFFFQNIIPRCEWDVHQPRGWWQSILGLVPNCSIKMSSTSDYEVTDSLMFWWCGWTSNLIVLEYLSLLLHKDNVNNSYIISKSNYNYIRYIIYSGLVSVSLLH